MRFLAIAGCLLAGLVMLTPAGADALYGGPYAGTVADGETDTHNYSTHAPGTYCLAIYIPHTFIVTLTGAATDTLTLTVGGLGMTSSNGVAHLSFTANYCTGFGITVGGVDVTAGGYAVTVEHFNEVPAVLCCMS